MHLLPEDGRQEGRAWLPKTGSGGPRYIFAGTLREQVAYPTWHESLLLELGDAEMERLSQRALALAVTLQ